MAGLSCGWLPTGGRLLLSAAARHLLLSGATYVAYREYPELLIARGVR